MPLKNRELWFQKIVNLIKVSKSIVKTLLYYFSIRLVYRVKTSPFIM